MSRLLLYPALVTCVLGLLGCAQEQTERAGAPAAPTRADTRQPDASAAPVVLVLGNSIAAGYGLHPDEAFPARLQQRIDSLGWSFRVVNAGLSGETTAGGLRRLDWALRQPVAVLVVELGGNDGLRGFPAEETRRNLAGIIDRARARYPDIEIILTGMQVPPNLGQEYTAQFRAVYPALAREKKVHLVPFLLEGVGGVRSLNQSDGIHPTARGQRIVADNVWQTLRPVLEQLREPA